MTVDSLSENQKEKDKKAAALAAEKAEVWQSISALYIPLSLFIACVIFSGGVFLVYYGETAWGWAFITATVVIALSAFVALFRFQNKYRAQGIIGGQDTEMIGPKAKVTVDESDNSPLP